MITRREFVAGALAAPALCRSGRSAYGPQRVLEHPERIFSGIMALDDVMGPLCPGGLICVAARPCHGKTPLLLQVALNFCETRQQNVIFASLREPPASIAVCAPTGRQTHALYDQVPDLKLWSPEEFPASPRVFIVAAQTDNMHHVGRVSRYLQLMHPASCGLVVLDGWTSDPSEAAPVDWASLCARYGASVELQPAPDARPVLLRDAHLRMAQYMARMLKLPVLLGIRTAFNLQTHQGPKPSDLLSIRYAVEARAMQTVWLHRPELYWKNARRHDLKGITRLVGQRDRYDGARPMRSVMRYWPSHRAFVTAYGPLPDEMVARL